MARNGNLGFGGAPMDSEFDKARASEVPPKPRPRPNPLEWQDGWRAQLERGEVPEGLEEWLEEQHRVDMRDPEYRDMLKQERKKALEFKKRFEGWMREAQQAAKPGADI